MTGRTGRTTAKVAGDRWRVIWRWHMAGLSHRAIAAQLRIDESTVRYYVGKGQPAAARKVAAR
jgi:DNA-binding NarL/FixJ family response regulator